jgi:nucleoid-associated protein Lsr2
VDIPIVIGLPDGSNPVAAFGRKPTRSLLPHLSLRRSGTVERMATVTRTYLVDDIDNSTEDVETVRFNAEGTNYEIDLSAANAERLRARLARFVDAAHPVKAPAVATAKRRGRGKVAVASTKQQTQDIREWAKQAGLQVSSRGRISAAIVEQYNAEH